MAAPGPTHHGSSWNPFRCAGTLLPTHVLLAVKLIAVFLLANFVARYGSYYGVRLGPLPLEAGLALVILRLAAQGVAVGSAVLLIFNRWVPWLSMALGLAVTFEFALHRVDYSELFLGVFLFLAGLQREGREPALLRYTVVASFVSAGLCWLLGSGSALLLDALAGRVQMEGVPPSESFRALEAAMPSGLPAQLTDWTMAVVSFALAAGFLIRRLYPLAIWGAILLHCVWLLVVGMPGTISYALLSACLVFVTWPQQPLVVIYDGDCGFCNKTREWISLVDFDGLYRWMPFQSGAGADFGIAQKALEEKVHVVAGDRIYKGFRGFRAMALFNPASWLSAAILIALVGAWAPAIRDRIFVALVLLFSPLFYPLGEAGYGWVARNRHRLPPRTCKVPE